MTGEGISNISAQKSAEAFYLPLTFNIWPCETLSGF